VEEDPYNIDSLLALGTRLVKDRAVEGRRVLMESQRENK
jgi:hypothetical protein